DCASRLAGRFGGIVEGVALRLPQISVVGPDPVVTVTFPRAEQEDLEIISSARRIFDAYFASETADGLPESQRPRHRWRAVDPVDDAALASLARVYDLTVVGRPQAGTAGPRMTTLESVLFESGRPLLIAPPQAPRSLGD